MAHRNAQLPIAAGTTAGELLDLALAGELEVGVTAAARSAIETCARGLSASSSQAEGGIYGVTTGLGSLGNREIHLESSKEVGLSYLENYAVGQGRPLPSPVVRLAMLLRANSFAQGLSGVRPELVERILDLLRAGITPVVPREGSLGASGDLIAQAHIAQVLTGGGKVEVAKSGEQTDALTGLRQAGIEPVQPSVRECVALLNGYSVSAAVAVAAIEACDRLLKAADLTAAQSLLAVGGHAEAFAAEFDATGWGQQAGESAERIRRLVAGKPGLGEFSRFGPHDPYSLRCVPQIHGASGGLIADAKTVVERTALSVSDNPVAVVDGQPPLSGGMFHAADLALRMDSVSMALATLAGVSERRIALMIDDGANGGVLPRGLAMPGEGASSYVPLQVLAASHVATIRLAGNPVSLNSLPVEAGLQDFVSLSLQAGLKVADSAVRLAQVLAIEGLIALRAAVIRGQHVDAELPEWLRGVELDESDQRRRAVSNCAQRLLGPALFDLLDS